jgi:hypothetical protein
MATVLAVAESARNWSSYLRGKDLILISPV